MLLLGKPLDFSLRFGQAFARDCRIVAVDVEPTAPDARIALALDADPAGGAARLAEHASLRRWPRSTWREQVESARQASPPEWAEWRRSAREPIHPLRVCAALAPHVAAGRYWCATAASSASGCRRGSSRASACSTA